MKQRGSLIFLASSGAVILSFAISAQPHASPKDAERDTKTFTVQGVVREINAEAQTLLVRHEAISNFMDAMTMLFKVVQPDELRNVRNGDTITFRLHVTATESWIDHITKLETYRTEQTPPPARPETAPVPVAVPRHPLLDCKFTNELGQAVTLGDFKGQGLAITFFFTRCPLPDFCPRLSKNFQEASHKLSALPGAPTNWHFLSVSIDPEFDTPTVLKTYGKRYQYDPAR